MRLVWTSAAVIDLEQISDYIFEKNPELAAPTIQRVFESASELKLFPRRGRPGRKEGTRELVLRQLPYLVVYEIVARASECCVFCMELVGGLSNFGKSS